MNKKLLCLSALLLTAVMACLGAFQLKSFGDLHSPIGLGIDDPVLTAEQFCDALDSGDATTVESMLNGAPEVIPEFDPDQQVDKELYDNLMDSIRCKLDRDGTVEGMNACFEVDVTYFSVSLAAEDIRVCAQHIYDDMLSGGSDGEQVYDEHGNILESYAMKIYEQAVQQVLSDRDSYTVSKSFPLELVYSNKRWEVILNDELADVMLGKPSN